MYSTYEYYFLGQLIYYNILGGVITSCRPRIRHRIRPAFWRTCRRRKRIARPVYHLGPFLRPEVIGTAGRCTRTLCLRPIRSRILRADWTGFQVGNAVRTHFICHCYRRNLFVTRVVGSRVYTVCIYVRTYVHRVHWNFFDSNLNYKLDFFPFNAVAMQYIGIPTRNVHWLYFILGFYVFIVQIKVLIKS